MGGRGGKCLLALRDGQISLFFLRGRGQNTDTILRKNQMPVLLLGRGRGTCIHFSWREVGKCHYFSLKEEGKCLCFTWKGGGFGPLLVGKMEARAFILDDNMQVIICTWN